MADTTVKTPTVEEQFKAREAQSQQGINQTYDTNLNNQKEGLLNAYNANTAAQAQQRQGIQKNFGVANYDIGVQNDRNDRNVTQFADVRDVNTGLGSQHRLNLNNARNNATGKLAFQQQQALQESDRQAALMETNYKNRVAAALADNDYKRAAALMDDYNNQNTWREQQAQILASYGDFSGYKPLYGDDTTGLMEKTWNAQNPEAAYRMGRIDAETYKRITGSYPRGYNPGGGGWGGGGYGPAGEPEQTASLYGLNTAGAHPGINHSLYHTAYSTQTPSLYGLSKASK